MVLPVEEADGRLYLGVELGNPGASTLLSDSRFHGCRRVFWNSSSWIRESRVRLKVRRRVK